MSAASPGSFTSETSGAGSPISAPTGVGSPIPHTYMAIPQLHMQTVHNTSLRESQRDAGFCCDEADPGRTTEFADRSHMCGASSEMDDFSACEDSSDLFFSSFILDDTE